MNDDKIKKVKLLQAKVLERFMKPEELEALLKRYNENRGQTGIESRRRFLQKPILPHEMKALAKYLDTALLGEGGITAKELATMLGISKYSATPSIALIALRLLYQNKEKLNLEELTKGGEVNDK